MDLQYGFLAAWKYLYGSGWLFLCDLSRFVRIYMDSGAVAMVCMDFSVWIFGGVEISVWMAKYGYIHTSMDFFFYVDIKEIMIHNRWGIISGRGLKFPGIPGPKLPTTIFLRGV